MLQLLNEDVRTRILMSIHTVCGLGAVHLSELLPATTLAAWQQELERGPFRVTRDLDHPVEQEFEAYSLRPGSSEAFPITDQFTQELVETLRRSRTSQVVTSWRPNEIAVQRYRPTHRGITPHRDYERDRVIVAVVTVAGTARFRHYSDDGETLQNWLLGPGSLVLLRAPDLTGRDDRPYHSIEPPVAGTRISVGIRYNRGATS